jgi:hypothetical protein
MAGFAVATAVVPCAVVAWLAAIGGLAAWWEIVVGYLLPFYSRLGRPPTWAFHRWQIWIPIAVAVVLSTAFALRGARFTVRHGMATLGVGYGLAHHFGQGKGWEYHLYPLAAFAAVLSFSALAGSWRRGRVFAGPLLAALVLALVLLAQKGAEAGDGEWIRGKVRLVDQLTGDLRAMVPGQPVQVLDTTEGGIHALLRLRAVQPTRFLYDFHFFHDLAAPVIRALRAEFLRDLDAHPPAAVVLFERGWLPDPGRAPGPDGRRADSEAVRIAPRLAWFPELARRLDEGYVVIQRRPGYVLYAKRRDP